MTRTQWTVLGIAFLARIGFGFQFQSVGALAPLLTPAFETDYAGIGTLIGIYLLPGIVLALPSGLLGRRYGDKSVMIFGLVLMALGALILAASKSYEVAFIGRLLSGVGAVFLNVLMAKFVADFFSGTPNLPLAMALFLNGFPAGNGLALISSGPIAEWFSWSLSFHLSAAICCCVILLLALSRARPQLTAAVAPNARFYLLSLREVWLVSLSGISWALYNAGYVLVTNFSPTLLTSSGMSISTAGLLSSVVTWLFIAAMPLGAQLAERFGRPTAFIALCLTTAGLAILLLPLWPTSVLLLVMIGVFGGAPAGLIISLPTEILHSGNRGPGMGLFFTWLYSGMATAPMFGGLAQDMSNSVAAPLVLSAASFIAAVGALFVFRGVQARPLPHPV